MSSREPSRSDGADKRFRKEVFERPGSSITTRSGPTGGVVAPAGRNYACEVDIGPVQPPPESAGTGGVATVELEVGGMHCQSCAALIEETLERDPGVHQAAVDLNAARASVVYDPQAVSVDEVCAAVTSAGYTAVPLTSGDPAS